MQQASLGMLISSYMSGFWRQSHTLEAQSNHQNGGLVLQGLTWLQAKNGTLAAMLASA